MLDQHQTQALHPHWLGYLYFTLGSVAYESNDLDAATGWFEHLRSLRYLTTSRFFQEGPVGLALIAQARGDQPQREAHIRTARAWALDAGDPMSLRIADSLALRFRLDSGAVARRYQEPPPADDYPWIWLEIPSVTWAEYLIRAPAPEVRQQATTFIQDALSRARRYDNRQQMLVFSILQVMALDALGEQRRALDGLSNILMETAALGLVSSQQSGLASSMGMIFCSFHQRMEIRAKVPIDFRPVESVNQGVRLDRLFSPPAGD